MFTSSAVSWPMISTAPSKKLMPQAKATRAKQFLFSLSLNPPPKARVPTEVFESAIERVEERLGLRGQPRTVIFHEKDGRRHAHAVWSRIDTQAGKAINLPHYKLKLRDVARELFLEHGWKMPPGFVSSKERDPLTFTHDQWQQAQRAGQDPRAIKRLFQGCWAISDSGKAFAQALKARGYTLARGDRRGYVAVDHRGEVYAIAKYAGIRTKQVKDRIGDPALLPSVEDAQREVAARSSLMFEAHMAQAERSYKLRSASLQFQVTQVKQRQHDEREKLRQMQEQRWNAEIAARAARLSKGFRGIWDRLIGRHAEIRNQNERETLLSFYRDREEKDGLIFRHIEERQGLVQRVREGRKAHALEMQRLNQESAGFAERQRGAPSLREKFGRAVGRNPFDRGPKTERDFEPEM
jgi:hypothetical protein